MASASGFHLDVAPRPLAILGGEASGEVEWLASVSEMAPGRVNPSDALVICDLDEDGHFRKGANEVGSRARGIIFESMRGEEHDLPKFKGSAPKGR